MPITPQRPALRQLVDSVPRGAAEPALVLPSYGLGDAGMAPLRFFLRQSGYGTPLSGIEWNLDRGDLRIRRIEDAVRFRSHQVDRVVARFDELHASTGQEPSLVGWSMGGLFALDASQRRPSIVSRVVTLGSPFGDPRGTALWDVMRWLSGSDVPADEQDFSPWLDRTSLATTEVPVTVLYSETGGIVGREIARLDDSRAVSHRHVASSHLGFATNPDVFRQIAQALYPRR